MNYLKSELYSLLKEDPRIFDFIQEAALDGLWYWDLEQPENEWMNPKFWKVLGYNPEEMPHKAEAWQDKINQEDLQLATENFKQHLDDETFPYDQVVRYFHKDGQTAFLQECLALIMKLLI
jgi:PAS domain S-box-containing protein